jgi:hypothetical protein
MINTLPILYGFKFSVRGAENVAHIQVRFLVLSQIILYVFLAVNETAWMYAENKKMIQVKT